MFQRFHVGIHHQPGELTAVDGGHPAQFGLRTRRIPDQRVNFCRAQIALVEADVVLPVQPDPGESDLQEFPNGDADAGGKDVIVGFVDLQHAPHALDILWRVSPVAHSVEIAHVHVVLDTGLDGRNGAGDLAGHESLTAAG